MALRVVLVLCVLGLAMLVAIPPDICTRTDYELTRVSILKPGLNTAVWYTGLASSLGLLFIPPIAGKRRLPIAFWLSPVATLVAFPAAGLHRMGNSLAPWVISDSCRGPDGETYVYMESCFLQGQTLALGRVLPDGWLYKRFDILGDTNGDSPRSYALIVRPVGRVRSNEGQLHLSDDGVLLGLRYNNVCYFAYDFSKKRFIGHGDIEGISPFLLIGPNSRLVATDVDSLLTLRGVPPVDGTGMRPSTHALEDALTHENDAVREVANVLLGIKTQD